MMSNGQKNNHSASSTIKDDTLKSIEIIDKQNIYDLFVDFSDTGIDAIIKNKILKNIPIVKSVVVSIDVVNQIKNYRFLKKIFQFLYGYKNFSKKEKEKFGNYINENSKNLEEFLDFLEKSDQIKKSEIFAKLIKARINDKIDEIEFQRYKYALANIDYHKLNILVQYYKDYNFNKQLREKIQQITEKEKKKLQSKSFQDINTQEYQSFLTSFANVGLLSIEVGYLGNNRTPYYPNDFGKRFIKIINLEKGNQ